MLSISGINNSYYNQSFGAKTKKPAGLTENMELLKNRIIAEERAINPYCEEVINSIETKFNGLNLKIVNLASKSAAELNNSLKQGLSYNGDITNSYILLGDLEKKISQI